MICFFDPCYYSKIIRDILKNVQKTSASVLVRLMTMKMRVKMKNRSQRYDLNRLRSRHGHKYIK